MNGFSLSTVFVNVIINSVALGWVWVGISDW